MSPQKPMRSVLPATPAESHWPPVSLAEQPASLRPASRDRKAKAVTRISCPEPQRPDQGPEVRPMPAGPGARVGGSRAIGVPQAPAPLVDQAGDDPYDLLLSKSLRYTHQQHKHNRPVKLTSACSRVNWLRSLHRVPDERRALFLPQCWKPARHSTHYRDAVHATG